MSCKKLKKIGPKFFLAEKETVHVGRIIFWGGMCCEISKKISWNPLFSDPKQPIVPGAKGDFWRDGTLLLRIKTATTCDVFVGTLEIDNEN